MSGINFSSKQFSPDFFDLVVTQLWQKYCEWKGFAESERSGGCRYRKPDPSAGTRSLAFGGQRFHVPDQPVV